MDSQADIRGRFLSWIENDLSGREQKTRVRGASSNQVQDTSGVPQGSVLGPLLFLMYVNSLPKGLDSYESIFLDDAKVMREARNDEDCVNLQRDFRQTPELMLSLQHLLQSNEMQKNEDGTQLEKALSI